MTFGTSLNSTGLLPFHSGVKLVRTIALSQGDHKY